MNGKLVHSKKVRSCVIYCVTTGIPIRQGRGVGGSRETKCNMLFAGIIQ